MKRFIFPFIIIIILLMACNNNTKTPDENNTSRENVKNTYTIVIHGGAGGIHPDRMSPERIQQYETALAEALDTGAAFLSQGGNALEAVERTIKIMEDSPLFNAGKGSVFNHEGKQRMDASIMDGRDLSSGAVSGVSLLKNPIEAARIVKDSTRHVFLYGEKCQEFCLEKGATFADSDYFFDERRFQQLEKARAKDALELDHDGKTGDIRTEGEGYKYGTVGCVVLDQQGNLAAGTSTGGMTNKKYGRIGDSPVIGAGTYANNESCAVSCTGTGEFFIRGTIARDVAAIMEYQGTSLETSAQKVMDKLNRLEGSGGFIAVDNQGNFVMPFNTDGMFRAVRNSSGYKEVKMFQ